AMSSMTRTRGRDGGRRWRRRAAPWLAIAVALVVASRSPDAFGKDAAAKAKSEQETKAKAEVVAELVEYAKWCAQNGAKTEGAAAVEDAKALGAASAVGDADAAIGKLSEDAADAEEKVA